MTRIEPVNDHLQIQPVPHETFIPTGRDTYEEKGIVLRVAESLKDKVVVGDKVYFDAWLAAKFPAAKEGEFTWFVKWEDVRAVEYA